MRHPDLLEDQQPSDPNMAARDGSEDRQNPQNMSRARKWTITLSLSTMTSWITFASSVFSQTTHVTSIEYNVSEQRVILATTLPVIVSYP